MGSEKLIGSFLLLHFIIILFLKPPMKNFNLSLYNIFLFLINVFLESKTLNAFRSKWDHERSSLCCFGTLCLGYGLMHYVY